MARVSGLIIRDRGLSWPSNSRTQTDALAPHLCSLLLLLVFVSAPFPGTAAESLPADGTYHRIVKRYDDPIDTLKINITRDGPGHCPDDKRSETLSQHKGPI